MGIGLGLWLLYHLSMIATRPESAGSDPFDRVPAHVFLRQEEDEDEEKKKDDDKEDGDEDETTDDGYSE